MILKKVRPITKHKVKYANGVWGILIVILQVQPKKGSTFISVRIVRPGTHRHSASVELMLQNERLMEV